MSLEGRRQRVLVGSVLFAVVFSAPVTAQGPQGVPDFSSNFAGWVGNGGGGTGSGAVPGKAPGPIVSDPAHPFVANGRGQPTFRIADLADPNLMPWVKDAMKKDIDEILAGKKSAFTAQSSCVPAGVPFFMGYGGPDPVVFLQTPKEGWVIWTEDNQGRRVYLKRPPSRKLKTSSEGESARHYRAAT